ncbi:MAG: hypothetical protein ACOYMR_01435, partial [Ilumatobacteraceae bacterium]
MGDGGAGATETHQRALRPFERNVLVAMAIAGAALVAGAGWFAQTLADLLPQAATIRSRGTAFGDIATVGTHVLRMTGIALLAGAAAGTWLRRLPWTDDDESATSERVLLLRRLAVFGIPFLAYLYLASPHNAYPTNSRIHWVDFTSWNSDDFFYAAGHLPHAIFYRHPAWWQALNAGLLALTVDLLLRRIGVRRNAALVLTLVFMSSSTVLLFADTAEDVMLNFLLLTLVLLAMTTDSHLLRGGALALAVLGRPNFLALVGAWLAVWAAMVLVRTLRRRRFPDESTTWSPVRSLLTVVWAVAFVALSQVVMSILGNRYLLSNGRLLDLGHLSDLAPIDTDGFLISPFSGAYIGHMLWLVPWIVPIALVTGGVVWFADATRGPLAVEADEHLRRRGTVLLFCGAAVAVLLFVHEAKPLLYFNIRYFSYAFPFLFVGAIAGARQLRGHTRAIATAFLATTVVAAYVLPVNPIATHDRNARRAEVFLYPLMDRLQDARGDR